MRFLRMRPAVWAMISCSFSSLTRKVAFGSSSVTTPGNSRSSSFGIRYPALCNWTGGSPRPGGAETSGIRAVRQLVSRSFELLVAGMAKKKPHPDPLQQLIADLAIGVEALLATAFD